MRPNHNFVSRHFDVFAAILRLLGAVFPLLWAGHLCAVHWTGFGSVEFTGANRNTNDLTRQGSFGFDPLVIHMHDAINDRIHFMGELAIEGTQNGKAELDPERYQISYRQSDGLQITAGRMHNILGYWNTAYHHGKLFHVTVDRPVFLEFEDDGGTLPMHIVGAWVGGGQDIPLGYLQYDLMVGNGSRIENAGSAGARLIPGNLDNDKRNNRAASLNLTFRPDVLPGSGIGIFTNFSQLRGYDATNPQLQIVGIRQSIYGADLSCVQNRLELLSEFYAFKDQERFGPVIGPVRDAIAYYAQLSYGFGGEAAYRPYARYEGLSRRDTDPYFTALGFPTYHSWIAGTRWTMDVRSAINLEWRLQHRAGLGEFNEWAIQWSFSF